MTINYLASLNAKMASPFVGLRALARQLAGLALFGIAACAWAGEAAHVFHAEGDVKVDQRPVRVGDAVAEGQLIVTGADGYIYMKTLDDGLFTLRPNSTARIASYHIDAKHPENTRIKLELLKGIARSQSGTAVKAARQNFRFNTPVAAIGVRGTDFVVFTDAETSRVSVLSGAIIISGFGGSCNPSGVGPCEGNASRELMATQVGQLLQVRRGQAAPQLLSNGVLTPDAAPPPHVEEPPVVKAATPTVTVVASVPLLPATVVAGTDFSLDAQKNINLLQKFPLGNNGGGTGGAPVVVGPGDPVVVVPPVTPVDPVVPPVVVIPPVVPDVPVRQVIWGRYESLAGLDATLSISKQLADKSQLVAQFGSYALMRTTGADWVVPTRDTVAFSLQQSEAMIRNESTNISTLAQIENGKLSVDFGKATFATSFDLVASSAERIKLQAGGDVTKDGLLIGGGQFTYPNNMAVMGAMGPEKGGVAAYIFQSRLDNSRIATGATYWTK